MSAPTTLNNLPPASPELLAAVSVALNVPGGIRRAVNAVRRAHGSADSRSDDVVVQIFARSFASIGGLAQASKNAQFAALNQTPIEAMMLERMTKSLDELSRIERNTRNGGAG